MNVTEKRNPNSTNIDKESTKKILEIINKEDQSVPIVLSNPDILNNLTNLVNTVVSSFQKDGRLFYIGAGTSGRLGILDASECVPTFGVDPTMVQGIIAGGNDAITRSIEGAEDSLTLSLKDLKAHNLKSKDVVVGIAASGRTPYVISGLQYAHKIGCKTGSISCNPDSEISKFADYAIEAEVEHGLYVKPLLNLAISLNFFSTHSSLNPLNLISGCVIVLILSNTRYFTYFKHTTYYSTFLYHFR